jgi:DNA invertase Pin-like site-specific DNA recombinase
MFNSIAMTKAIGYVRVSTQEQVEHGVSIDAQVSKVKAYCALYDIELVDIMVDAGVSAKTLNREGLQTALGMLGSGEVDALTIFKLDRLTRSVVDWNYLITQYFGDRADKALLSVSDQIDTRTAAGRLCLNVLMSVAQWEREAIGERTSVALRHKQSRGEHVGSPAFGFEMVEKKLEKIETEHQAISLIETMRSEGKTLQEIATHLNLLSIATKRGGQWYPTTIKNVLDR